MINKAVAMTPRIFTSIEKLLLIPNYPKKNFEKGFIPHDKKIFVIPPKIKVVRAFRTSA